MSNINNINMPTYERMVGDISKDYVYIQQVAGLFLLVMDEKRNYV